MIGSHQAKTVLEFHKRQCHIEWRKARVITLVNHKGQKQRKSNELIKTKRGKHTLAGYG